MKTLAVKTLRSTLAATFLVSALISAAGCDTSTAVFVAPSIDAPALTVGRETLGTTLKGTFVLGLELASRASGPSNVTIASFSIKNARGSTVLLEPIPFTLDRAQPVEVLEDSEVSVTVTVDTGATLLPKETADALCAGLVTIVGTIEDSLEDGASPVTSAPFTLSGC